MDTLDIFNHAADPDEARNRLQAAPMPDRLNEDWRFGRPRRYAAELAQLMEREAAGSVRVEAPEGVAVELAPGEAALADATLRSIGSDRLLALHLARAGRGVRIHVPAGRDLGDAPVCVTYETDGLFTPVTLIVAEPGSRVRLCERHVVRGAGLMFCARRVVAGAGARVDIELAEEGSGESRAFNLTNILVAGAKVRHLTTHARHAWAREETIASILASSEETPADVQLYSANRLGGEEVLDQHTRQEHACGGASSNLLYKNVLDGAATAIFAGNIRVEPHAHHTDAYQANRNLLLGETVVVHSLPGLEILADHVRCSHGSASAPMDEEQLTYLMSRGIPRRAAQTLVAEGFLEDVSRAME